METQSSPSPPLSSAVLWTVQKVCTAAARCHSGDSFDERVTSVASSGSPLTVLGPYQPPLSSQLWLDRSTKEMLPGTP